MLWNKQQMLCMQLIFKKIQFIYYGLRTLTALRGYAKALSNNCIEYIIHTG